MKIYIKRLSIALRYDSQGKPISYYHHDFPEPAELHPFTVDVPRGYERHGLIIQTRYGQYKVIVQVHKSTGVSETTYEHKALIPMPCGAVFDFRK